MRVAKHMSFSSGLVVESDRDRERARLRVVEVVHPARAGGGRDRAAQVRLGVVTRVIRPRLQVAPGDAHIDAREPDGALHPRRVDRIAHRDLAQLYEPAVLDARLVDADEWAGGDELVPVLPDRDRRVRPRASDRSVPPPALTKGLQVPGAHGGTAPRAGRPLLGVQVGAVAPQGTLGAVP